MKILYLARLREAFGTASEDLELPSSVRDVGALLSFLRTRGGAWSSQLEPGRTFRVAVNQEIAAASKAVGPDDEVAIFPPVTGG